MKGKNELKKAVSKLDYVKLNLGCGGILFDGYLNIDLYDVEAEYQVSLLDLGLDDNTVDEIQFIHVLDHLDYREGIHLIEECARMLKLNGTIKIECGDLNNICRTILNPKDKDELLMAYTCLNGLPWIDGMGHKFLYSKKELVDLLIKNGFVDIKSVPVTIMEPWSKEEVLKSNSYYGDCLTWLDDDGQKKLHLSIVAKLNKEI